MRGPFNLGSLHSIRSLGLACMVIIPAMAQSPFSTAFRDQAYQPPENCLPCHQRQYDELKSSVKSGYRNVSPLFNGLEMASNLLTGGLLRPVYADSPVVLPDGVPLNSNMFTSHPLKEIAEVRAGFCVTCHNSNVLRLGDDPTKRETPQLSPATGNAFLVNQIRPLRDYSLVDANGNQVLPATIGGPAPAGAGPSLGAKGITCDVCHNVYGPDLDRSFLSDGFANTSIEIAHTIEKIGPFPFAVAVKNEFHVASTHQDKIAFLRSGAFCNACHDVRVPVPAPGDLQHEEHGINPGAVSQQGVSNGPTIPVNYFRLENLSSEWQISAYNSNNNPFGRVVRCQDCHMSLFPFTPTSTYQVGDMTVTTPTPGSMTGTNFSLDFAAVPGISTQFNFPLPKRPVVNHYFTGVDVPLLRTPELQSRLGSNYPDPYVAGNDAHGVPLALGTRRGDLLDAAVCINLGNT